MRVQWTGRINDRLSKLLLAIEMVHLLESRLDEIWPVFIFNSMCVNDVFGFIRI